MDLKVTLSSFNNDTHAHQVECVNCGMMSKSLSHLGLLALLLLKSDDAACHLHGFGRQQGNGRWRRGTGQLHGFRLQIFTLQTLSTRALIVVREWPGCRRRAVTGVHYRVGVCGRNRGGGLLGEAQRARDLRVALLGERGVEAV